MIVETVFGWPGIGRLLVDAITKRDYPLVQAAILFITRIFVLINLLVDISYVYLDPRIRLRDVQHRQCRRGTDRLHPPGADRTVRRTRRNAAPTRGLPRLLGFCRFILFILIAIFGPMLVPYDSVTVRTGDRLEPPGAILRDGSRAWLGTDQVGRDMLAQVLQGARISLLVGAATVILAGLIGMAVGVIAGYRGGFFDSLLMRLADIQLAFPSIIFAIMIAAVIGPSVVNVIITLALTRWVVFARMSRAAVAQHQGAGVRHRRPSHRRHRAPAAHAAHHAVDRSRR